MALSIPNTPTLGPQGTRGREGVTRGREGVTRGRERVTRGRERVTRGREGVTKGRQRVTELGSFVVPIGLHHRLDFGRGGDAMFNPPPPIELVFLP